MRVPVGDLIFDVDEYGSAGDPTVVLLHGFPVTNASWITVAEDLAARGLRVHAPNQRGYSPDARPTSTSDYTVDKLVGDVVGLLDALELGSAHLVGHDWGAAVAWTAATTHPDRFSTLTAVSIPHPAPYGRALISDPDQKMRAGYIKLFRTAGKAEDLLLEDDSRRLRAMFDDAADPTIAEKYLPVVGQRDALTAGLNWYRAMTREFSELPATTVPTTFVWSNNDRAVSRSGAEQCGQWVDADYRFVELSCSHWVPEDAPTELADAIAERVAQAS